MFMGLVEPGEYVGTCESVELVYKKLTEEQKLSGVDPDQQLEWKFGIFFKEKVVSLLRWTPALGKGVSFTREILEALPCEYAEPKRRDGKKTLEFDTDNCVGKRCTLVIGSREYQGQERNEIKSFRRLE